jgi:hypothetical protein
MLKRIVLGFALVALVVPAGRAKAVPDAGRTYEPAKVEIGTPAGLNDYNGIELARLQPRSSVRADIEVVRLQPRSTLRNTDMIEKVRVSPREVSTPQVVASPGIDWSDAAIGAGLAIGLMLLAGAAFYSTRHLGKAQTA